MSRPLCATLARLRLASAAILQRQESHYFSFMGVSRLSPVSIMVISFATVVFGKAVAVLLAPMNDEDLDSLLLARSPPFQSLLAKSRESIQAGKGLPSRDFWKAAASRNRTKAGRK